MADPIIKISILEFNINNVKILLSKPNINVNSLIYLSIHKYRQLATSFLNAAIFLDNKDIVKYLISQNADINSTANNIVHPMVEAAKIGNISMFKLLHELGGNINFIDQLERSLLTIAVMCRNNDVAKYLIEQGLDVNSVNPWNGMTPLHYACRFNYKGEIIKLLIDNRADIHKKCALGRTSLIYALLNGNLDNFKLLIDLGADINNAGPDHTLLKFARHNHVIDYLLSLDEKVTDIHYIDVEKKTLLHYVAMLFPNSVEILRLYSGNILDAGIDVNVKDSSGGLAINCNQVTTNNFYDLEIKRHIVKLILAGMTVCEENQRAVDADFEDLRVECYMELKKMKIVKISGNNLSFFDVLAMSSHYLAIRLKFAGLDKVTDKEKLKIEYPLYGGIIFYKLSKVNRRIKYLEEVEHFTEGILCELGLPLSFTRELWYYFTNIELKKMILEKHESIFKFL